MSEKTRPAGYMTVKRGTNRNGDDYSLYTIKLFVDEINGEAMVEDAQGRRVVQFKCFFDDNREFSNVNVDTNYAEYMRNKKESLSI